MIYKEFKGKKLSALGFGMMRLPVIDGKDAQIDKELTKKMVKTAMDAGVNYYDTAWGYHGGNSELVAGECLKEYPRDSFYLASKFPGYDLSNMSKAEEIFEKQLEKCQTEYFDFYLIHNVCELNIDEYLNPEHKIKEFFVKQRENGRIKHLGFSAHGDIENMKQFLAAYGDEMEFCQIQLNYYDYTFQNAKGKIELLKEWNLPVWVMEPVRGGQLASLKEDAEAKLKEKRPDESTASWAFRFLQSLPDVVVTLSGMTNMAQLEENIKTYEEAKPLNEEEKALILGIADEMIHGTTVHCTGCRYCTGKCPMGLDIPTLLSYYNEAMVGGSGNFIASMGVGSLPNEKKPTACIECHACEQVCPQKIEIPNELKNLQVKLEEIAKSMQA